MGVGGWGVGGFASEPATERAAGAKGAPCWFENLNERERKGERAAAAWRTRGGGVVNARRQRQEGERAAAAVSARTARSLYI